MTRIFGITPKYSECQAVIPRNRSVLRQLFQYLRADVESALFGRIELERDPDSETSDLSDMCCMTRTALIISEKAHAVMLKMVPEQDVEWIPALFEGRNLWIGHVLTVSQALFEDDSQLIRAADGKVMVVERVSVNARLVGSAVMFRLGNGMEGWYPFVREEVRDAILKADLKGFEFSEAQCVP